MRTFVLFTWSTTLKCFHDFCWWSGTRFYMVSDKNSRNYWHECTRFRIHEDKCHLVLKSRFDPIYGGDWYPKWIRFIPIWWKCTKWDTHVTGCCVSPKPGSVLIRMTSITTDIYIYIFVFRKYYTHVIFLADVTFCGVTCGSHPRTSWTNGHINVR